MRTRRRTPTRHACDIRKDILRRSSSRKKKEKSESNIAIPCLDTGLLSLSAQRHSASEADGTRCSHGQVRCIWSKRKGRKGKKRKKKRGGGEGKERDWVQRALTLKRSLVMNGMLLGTITQAVTTT